MNTHEACADLRARIGAIAVEAIRGLEAQVGMTIYEYAARKAGVWETGLDWNGHDEIATIPAEINATYYFQLLKCGRWLPLNNCHRPTVLRPVPGNNYAGDEAYAHLAVRFPVDPYTVGGVWTYKEDTMLWLYNEDDPESMRTYYKRFARLVAAMDTWRTPAPAAA